MTLGIRLISTAVCIAAIASGGSDALSREIHVSQTGSDSDSGSQARPYLTVSKAASVAQPGDVVTVHGGTYREWVKPPRGGTGEDSRIVYRAAPGEVVFIKGSERITSWKHQQGGVWKAELPNSLFGDYNPFALKVSGGWLNYGQWHHRGDVYLNGEAFHEKETAKEVDETGQSWHCRMNDDATIIRANFGKADPNTEVAEINVRESLFMPEVTGLKYINIFIRRGLDRVKTAQGYQSDYNVFLEGAKKSSFGDDNSLVAADLTGLAVKDHPLGATITFSIGDPPLRASGPRVNAELAGVFPTVGQTIEDRDGNPITIDTDVSGKRFVRPIPGPLANLQQGKNVITWSMRK